MKKNTFLYILLLALALALMDCLSGCDEGTPQDQDKMFNSMACPCVLMAKHNETKETYGSIVIKDGNGMASSFSTKYSFAEAIIDSYNVGDTLKKCK
jgi:hypothetical protein